MKEKHEAGEDRRGDRRDNRRERREVRRARRPGRSSRARGPRLSPVRTSCRGRRVVEYNGAFPVRGWYEKTANHDRYGPVYSLHGRRVATGIFIVDRNLELERGILKADLFSSGRIAGYVDLNPEQVRPIDEIGLRYRDDLAAYNARMHTSRAELKNAFFDANADEEGVVRVFARNRQTMTELMRLRYRKYREINAVLTPGQRERYALSCLAFSIGWRAECGRNGGPGDPVPLHREEHGPPGSG